MLPTPIVHIMSPVAISEYELVNRLRPIHIFIDEGLAQQILVRTLWLIRYGYTYPAYHIIPHVVCGKKEIILIVFFNNAWCPHRTLRPFGLSRINYSWMLRPIHQV